MSLRERLESRLSKRRAEDLAAEESRRRRAAARESSGETPAERPRSRGKEDDSPPSSASLFEAKLKTEGLGRFRIPAKELPETDGSARANPVPEEQPERRPKLPIVESSQGKHAQEAPRGGSVGIAANTTAFRRRSWDHFEEKRITSGKVPERDAEASQRGKQKRASTRVAEMRQSELMSARQSSSAREEAGKGYRSSERRRSAGTPLCDETPERARPVRSEHLAVSTAVPAIRAAEGREEHAQDRANDRRLEEASSSARPSRKVRAESFSGKQKASHLGGQDEKPDARRAALNQAKRPQDGASSTMRPRNDPPAHRERSAPTKAVQVTRVARPNQTPQFRKITASASARSALVETTTSTAAMADPEFDPTFTSIATPIGIYPPAAVPLPALSTQGAYILTPDSVAVGMHGVNVVGFDTLQSTSAARSTLGLDDVSLAVLQQLWHFNVVRLPVQAQTILQGNGSLNSDDVLNVLTEIVEAAAQAGLYTLLAIEAVPGIPVQLPDAATIQALQKLAGSYSSSTAVLYEIFATAEPLSSSWVETAPSQIAAIRSQSPAALIFVNSGNGGFDMTQLPLLSPIGEAIFGIVYTINLGGDFPTPDVNLLANLAGRCPVCATQWTSDDGPISAYHADLLGRNGIHWIASNWNADPLLANDVVAHDYSATSWGMLAIRAALYPLRPFLLPFGRTVSKEPEVVAC